MIVENPDYLMENICRSCKRHSISAEAKKQCKYLALVCCGEDVDFIDEDYKCNNLKQKTKRIKKKQDETLF